MLFFSNDAIASVPPTPGNLDHAIEAVAKYYESHPELEGWGAQSNQFKAEGDKAIASVENMEKQYTGSSELQSKPPTGLDSTSENNIKELVEQLSKDWERLGSSEGATTDAIGGEALDAAESAGLVTALSSSAAGIILGSIPLTATLAYEDITTGTNFVTVGIFSGQQDYEKIESQGGIAASKVKWQRFPELKCNSSQGISNCLELRVAKVLGSSSPITGENWLYEHSQRLNYETGGKEPEGLSVPSYYLDDEVGGHYYIIANGLYGESLTEISPGWPWEENKSGGCFVRSISGFPEHLYKGVATDVLIGGEPKTCEHGERAPYLVQSYISVAVARTPSRMHIGPPVHSTKSQVEKLEAEGHTVKHLEGHIPTPETLPETFKKLSEKLKEKGQRRLEEYECAHMECEQEHVPAEPETENKLEPSLPEKPEGQSPAIPGYSEVPSCFVTELSGTQCVELIKEDGFSKVELDTVTWEHAVVSKPANAVISVNPGAGSSVETSTTITVDQNPDAEEMPDEVPHIKRGEETGTQYKERLEREGWTKVQVRTLPEISTDPGIGPDQASYTNPAEGSSTAPGKATEITVEQNPEDAPAAGQSGSGIGPPTLPGFKIPRFGVLCRGFPFGVPCWLINTIKSWSAASVCPKWSFGEFTVHGKKIPETVINLCTYGLEPLMEKARVAMLIFSTLGIVLLFYTFAKGGSPPSGGGAKDVTTEYDADGTEYRVGW